MIHVRILELYSVMSADYKQVNIAVPPEIAYVVPPPVAAHTVLVKEPEQRGWFFFHKY